MWLIRILGRDSKGIIIKIASVKGERPWGNTTDGTKLLHLNTTDRPIDWRGAKLNFGAQMELGNNVTSKEAKGKARGGITRIIARVSLFVVVQGVESAARMYWRRRRTSLQLFGWSREGKWMRGQETVCARNLQFPVSHYALPVCTWNDIVYTRKTWGQSTGITDTPQLRVGRGREREKI